MGWDQLMSWGLLGQQEAKQDPQKSMGWGSCCGTCPCVLLPWTAEPMSSKEIFRFCGSLAVVFSRKFLTFTKICKRCSGVIAEGVAAVAT